MRRPPRPRCSSTPKDIKKTDIKKKSDLVRGDLLVTDASEKGCVHV
jgi:hypothetical protein